MAFIVYAAATAIWPVLALHAVLLPVNLLRLLELRRLQRPSNGRDRRLSAPTHEPAEERR